MKTVAIIQARLGSTRLPGKILLDIVGKTMIERVVSRLESAKLVDQIVIATTNSAQDDLFVDFCNEQGWSVHRGSENDVLSRYVGAAKEYSADRIVRVTSDCPLIDSEIVDDLIHTSSLANDVEYCCNFYPVRRYPRGLDCEVITMKALKRIDQLARASEHREHVTLFAYQNPSQFSMGSLSCRGDYSHLRWTVDTQKDLELVRQIYDRFSNSDNLNFNWKDVIAQYQHNPKWEEINQSILQKVA